MEKKIRGYTIASEISTDELSRRVNKLITLGWEPYGTLVIASAFNSDGDLTSVSFNQPMITYKPL